MKVAFVSLGSWGDAINSTLMFKPIKRHFESIDGVCSIEVHTTALYESAFHNNPYVNNIVCHQYQGKPVTRKQDCFALYNTVPDLVRKIGYDKVFVPAPILLPTKRNSLLHQEFGDNLICTFMRYLEDNGIDYQWPVETILRLTNSEIEAVNSWLKKQKVSLDNHFNILMEIHGESGQTFWNHNWTLAVSRHLMRKPSVNLFISRREKTADIAQLEIETNRKIKWVGELTLRECAELHNRCNAFFSVSSGLSNAANTNHCRKDLLWFEVVNDHTVTSAPLRTDNKVFWYKNDINAFTKMLAEKGL